MVKRVAPKRRFRAINLLRNNNFAQYIHCMKIRIGPPVVGENFFLRPDLIGLLKNRFSLGNLAFLGPRRTGKTSCLRAILADPGDYLPIYMNLEEHDSVERWFGDMLEELRTAFDKPEKAKRLGGKVSDFLKRIEKVSIPGGGGLEFKKSNIDERWRRTADEFLNLLLEADVPIVFLIDEFPVFLTLVGKNRDISEVESVLNWFRAARQKLAEKPVHFVITGSIGLKGVVRRFGLSPTINDFDVLTIRPLTDGQALEMLELLAADNDIPLSLAGRRNILKLLGANWPILLQLFISELQAACLTKPPTKAQLSQIYKERLVAGGRNQYCDGMYDRLKEVFVDGESLTLARAILKAVCLSPDGLTRTDFEKVHRVLVPDDSHRVLLGDELEYVLDTLEHDGYLLQETEGEQRTRFASNILRDFWLRKIS